MSNIDKSGLREELLNPAIGSNAHLRKLALALLDELEAAENRIDELELRLSQQQSIAANNLDMFRRADARVSELEAVGITDRSEIEGLKRGEMANVMPPNFKGVDAGDEVLLYAAPQLPQPAVLSEKMIDTFEAEFRRAFEVSPEVEQMLEIGYQGEKFSFSIRDAATWWKLGRAAMLQGGKL